MPFDLEGKVCPRHPEAPAVARCFGCFKPVCEMCLVKADNHEFCSEDCANAHAKTDASFQEFMELERKQKRKKLIKRIFAIILFITFGYVAIQFWISNPDTVDSWITIIAETFGSIKQAVMDTMDGLM